MSMALTRRRRVHPSAVDAAAGLLLLMVTALWVAGGGITQVDTLADGVTSLGRLAGLLASGLLLLQVVLMARVPMLERTVGQDGLVRLHHDVGTGSFSLMAAHVVLIVAGCSRGQTGDVRDTIVEIVTDMPGMLLAVAGTVAVIMVGVTSARRARARMRYESWHLLHLYAYLGCLLALPHQLWTGADFLASPVAAIFWWGLWAAAVLAVLGFRVALPLYRSRRHRLTVSSVRPRGHGVTTVGVTGRDLERLGALPGQFFTWRFLDGPGWTRGHPYSLSAAPDGDSLEITVAAVGDGSARLADLTRVLECWSRGPTGGCTRGCAGPAR